MKNKGDSGFGIGDFFKGLGSLIDLAGSLEPDESGEISRSGVFLDKKGLKGTYGLNIKIGGESAGGQTLKRGTTRDGPAGPEGGPAPDQNSKGSAAKEFSYRDIGGLDKELQKIREMIELPLTHPELFEHLGIEPPRGVLLYGPPGTGKTLIARAVAGETKACFIHVNGPEIIHKYYGESEARLREIFQKAAGNRPSIIFLDEIDAVAPKREEVTGEVEKRVVAQLLALMDGLKSRGQVIVIGATNLPNAIDPALRRPGRFDREIRVSIPDRKGRREILSIHTRGMPVAGDVDLDRLAEITHGFVGADLRALCQEAAMRCVRRVYPLIGAQTGKAAGEFLAGIKVEMKDFLEAMKEVEPSATREFLVDVPAVRWEDVGGLKEIKQELRQAVEWPLKYRELFETAGISPPRGVILHGPPGTGKTLLARALASEINANFIAVKGPSLLSKWMGESEKAVRELFRKAKQVAPCLVFFDEIDSLVPAREAGHGGAADRVLSQLLTEIDGIEELRGVVLLAATNRIDLIDPALLRPGRFDLHLRLDLPDKEAIVEIFKVHTRKMPLHQNIDLDALADACKGFSGADIRQVCHRAAILAMREYIEANKKAAAAPRYRVTMQHFLKSLEFIKNAGRGERLEKSKRG
ncbi:ATPase [Pelotomaculum thermopropionicum SI]|uniref:ATPase n=1 Tax=Pelotomaculum thermopropionicum (strain DSM 13744 / JCM 10971 / SI) TaxID=370438 RepID=A5D585_PELTS|nr:ATPase [Pelotomaculum thermopropionicum SI]